MRVNEKTIVEEFNREHSISLSQLPRKKIMFSGLTKNNQSIILITPSSKIHPRGHGWVDFTEIQITKLKEFTIAIVVFRLSDGTLYYIDFKNIYPSLTENSILENSREGRHWKLQIWPNELRVQNRGGTISTKPNDRGFLVHSLNQ